MSAVLLFLLLFSALASTEDDAYQSQRDDFAEGNFNEIMQMNAPVAARAQTVVVPPPAQPGEPLATARVPLDTWQAARSELQAVRSAQAGTGAPAVVLGASSFVGEALDGALSLTLSQRVTLSGEGVYKTVPLVGEQAVVVRARAAGQPIGLSSRNGYHVWITQQTGEVTLELDVLVPSRGRRGSLEYDFLIAKTPATRFDCTFPTAGLEPRLRGAVNATVDALPGATRLASWLEPQSRIHLVGFRDLGDDGARDARLYAESLDLLSVDEGTLELFTVIRYNILYAGAKRFDVRVPAGWTVVSADGEGAFRYVLEPDGEATIVKGETAFPIRNAYEISLRLRRDTEAQFDLELPRSLGVERAIGWLAVEVTSNLKLDEVSRREVLPVDVRQLPAEVLQSAVSPILRAYRYHDASARLTLSAERLPEEEPSGATIDRVEATTVVSAEGRTLTDVQITLRNRVRHSLALVLPEGAEVRSTLIDGAPVRPSVREDGALLLPLQRSVGDRPFTLQIVLEGAPAAWGVLGRRTLALPTLELPVASVAWSVWLPSAMTYAGQEGGPRGQRYAGNGRWLEATGEATVRGGEVALTPADTASLPVRIELPRTGHEISDVRYWVAADAPIELSVFYLWRSLRDPLVLFLLALAAAAAGLGLRLGGSRRMAAGLVVLAAGGAAWTVVGAGAVVVAVSLGAAAAWVTPARLAEAVAAVRAWWSTPPGEAPAGAWSARRPVVRVGLLVGAVVLVIWAFGVALSVL